MTPGVARQIARGPARLAQDVQQVRVHGGLLQHQRQVVGATKDGFEPVDEAQNGHFFIRFGQWRAGGFCVTFSAFIVCIA